ncbi:MAG TPA: hypothetical protein VFK97_01455 [Candidatus Saccharimonadales bacterium]|nr:hypothetical protein [Candidatus Saccharimonadales bacterium]
MNILRRLVLSLVGSLFVFLLFVTAFDVGFIRTATQPVTVKKLAADSGIYNSVVTSALDQLKSINTSVGTIDASNPLVQKAANQAVTPQYVQAQANAAIDNIYQWLNGAIAQPNFNIDLNGQKDQFAKNAADSLQQELSGLPRCTTLAQIRGFSVLNAVCLPPGITAQAIAAQVQTDLSNSDFLNQANISSANIKDQATGQSIFDSNKAQQIPSKYQLAKKTPWILAILTVLSGLGVVFLSRTRRAGLRRVGVSLAIVGLLILALSFFLPKVVSQDIAPKLKVNGNGVSLNLAKVVNDIALQVDRNYWFFGGLYTTAGAVALVTAEVARRRPRPAPAAKPKTNPS